MEDKGFQVFACDPAIRAWADHAHPVAIAAIKDPANAHWLRCGGTWFAGVDCLPNDPEGRLKGGPPLAGKALEGLPDLPLHKAQVSAIYPGYPRPKEGESAAAASYRMTRDAAHVDGLLPVGPKRRRMIREPHAYILGLPLTHVPPNASPLVVWEGSHRIMQAAFRESLGSRPVADWPDIDLTGAYHAARRQCFDTCKRVELPARPGEAVLLHRLALHGMAPWRADDGSARLVAYFRPETTFEDWFAA